MLLLFPLLPLAAGSGVGLATGSSTATGIGAATARSVGAAAGSSTAVAVGVALAAAGVGSAAGTSTVVGVGGTAVPPPPVIETGGESIRWLRRAPHVNDQQRRVRHTAAQLAMETGVGLASGQGSDPRVILRWSDNGGHTWSNEHIVSIGAIGRYTTRALWTRLGQGRNRVYEVSGTDPVSIALLDFYLNVEGEYART